MDIQTVLNLLTLTSQEVGVIGELNNCFEFDHNLFLVHSSADIDHFVGIGIVPKSLFTFESANETVDLESIYKIRSKNTFMILVPESSTFMRNLNLLKQIRKIQRHVKNMKIGIFFQNLTSEYDLRNYFMWLRNQLVVNVFAAAYPNSRSLLNIFTFHLFGTFEVINVTSRNTCEEFFPNLDSNYHQHKFRTAPFFNTAYKSFWLSAFKIMNATFTIEYVLYNTLQEYYSNGIDIVPLLGLLDQSFRMYPILLANENIIVPEAKPYSGFYSYLRMLTSNDFFGYSAGAIGTTILMLSACRYIKQKKFFFFQSFLDVLNLLINDNGFIKYQRLSRAETFLIVPLTFVGFVVVNGYLSSLQSYLTEPALQPQLKTVEDIYNSPLTITAKAQMVDVVRERVTYGSTHRDWSNKITEIDYINLLKKISQFDTSTTYLMNNLDFDMLSRIQRRMNIRGFYDTGVTVSYSLCILPVSDKIMSFDKINEIIHWTYSSGLFQRWLRENNAAIENKILDDNRNKLQIQQNDDEGLEFPMFIVYGWIASTIVLIVEIIWEKVKRTKK